MTKNPGKSPVSLVFPAKTPDSPPDGLKEPGRRLWADVVAAYDFADPAGRTLLLALCGATDRLAELSAAIDRDGAVLYRRGGQPRPNPCLGEERALRAYLTRTMARLGLEPLQEVGRPRATVDWIPPPGSD